MALHWFWQYMTRLPPFRALGMLYTNLLEHYNIVNPPAWSDLHDIPVLLYYESKKLPSLLRNGLRNTPEVASLLPHRIRSFNRVERILWALAPGRPILAFLALFMNISLVVACIGSIVADYTNPMPAVYEFSEGRKCGLPQYIYLNLAEHRVAKNSVLTRLDGLAAQQVLEDSMTVFFILPGVVMPFVWFKAFCLHDNGHLIYFMTWIMTLAIRCTADFLVFFMRITWSPLISEAVETVRAVGLSEWYLAWRYFVTFYSRLVFPILIWLCLSIIAHYRSMTRPILKPTSARGRRQNAKSSAQSQCEVVSFDSNFVFDLY